MTSDPTRLLEDPTALAGVRGDLAHAAAAGLEGLDVSAGAASLSTALLAESGAAGAAAGSGVLVKVAAVTAALAIVGGAAWAITRPAAEPASVVGASEASPAEPEPQVRLKVPFPIETPAATPESPARDVVAAPVLNVEESEPPPEEEAAAVVLESSKARPRPRPRPARRPQQPTETKSAQSDADRFAREAKLVSDARRALGSSPARALALTATAKKEIPKGMLVQEREAIAIRALVALERNQEASRRAKAFLVKFGNGPHADSVRRATSGL